MRLQEVERGESAFYRLLFRGLTLASGIRLPDAARAVLYHRRFFGDPMSAWTHAAMRGDSSWTVGERELMAAMTGKWNTTSFCIGAHGAIAARVLGRPLVQASLDDFKHAGLTPKLEAALGFLETLTRDPDQVTARDAQKVLHEQNTAEALEDAIAVSVILTIISRCADSLGYKIPDDRGFDRAAKGLLKRGYAFPKPKIRGRPDHRGMAEVVRQAVLEGPGVTGADLRQAMARWATDDQPVQPPYGELARQIGQAAFKVTDDQVAEVVEETGSERATYELIIAAAVGVGLRRWERGQVALKAAIQEEG